MRDLISFSYNIDATDLREYGEIFYIVHENSYTYIIPVGSEKNTIFFHLLKFINDSQNFNHIFTNEGAPTIQIKETHYYCLHSTYKLHQTITESQLNIPVLYPAEFPLATHFKDKWLQKNKIHEENLNLALDKTPPIIRAVLFDLTTYYIHLNEEAYRLLKSFEHIPFSTSLCHARIKPDTPLYQFFIPSYLTLDNRSRIYCEYIRHLYLNTGSLNRIEQVISHIAKNDPLTEAEWKFLYARLYFPTHFYDIVYDIIVNGEVNLNRLYEQTTTYSKLLAHLPTMVGNHAQVQLEVPEWALYEANL